MASRELAKRNEEGVAQALRELSLSRGDREGLADFLTDYYGSTQAEDLGKEMNFNRRQTLTLIIIHKNQ